MRPLQVAIDESSSFFFVCEGENQEKSDRSPKTKEGHTDTRPRKVKLKLKDLNRAHTQIAADMCL